MLALLLVNAPSLNTGSLKRFVVAIGQARPVSLRIFLKSFTVCFACSYVCSMGMASLS